ncbi:MAG: hypothetical protein QN720_11800 [Nitrososphaeraceae archaeon]|nr:hypothetical protein [Nitrososphaeraceae archaeon]MDW0333628.1 hypothetical protein [Nitrososphaeraceae archaeon]
MNSLIINDDRGYSIGLQPTVVELSNVIFFGPLVIHVVFGGVMGFCARLAVT